MAKGETRPYPDGPVPGRRRMRPAVALVGGASLSAAILVGLPVCPAGPARAQVVPEGEAGTDRGAVGRGEGARRSSAEHLRQGRHYLQLGRTELALRELEAGRSAPGGDGNAELHLQLFQLYLERLDLQQAFASARAARLAARNERQLEEAERLLDELGRHYSSVVVRSGNAEITRLQGFQIEANQDEGPVSLQKKQVLAHLQARLKERPLPLPATIYLPFGFYLIEGTPVQVIRGEEAEVVLRFAQAVARPGRAEQEQAASRRWWLLGGGAAALLLGALLLLVAGS